MKKSIFVTADLMKESFFKADSKIRRNIYIYLCCILFINLTLSIMRNTLIFTSLFDSLYLESIHPVIELMDILLTVIGVIALVNLTQKWIKSAVLEWFIFDIYLQTLPWVYIFLGLFNCFEMITGRESINSLPLIFSMLEAIITFWALTYIFHIRKLAVSKRSLLPPSRRG